MQTGLHRSVCTGMNKPEYSPIGFIQIGERADSFNCANGLCSSSSGLLLVV